MPVTNYQSVNSEINDLPLLELFTRLREAGMPLGIGEYELLVKALQGGFGIRDRSTLARLCRSLWVKSPDEDSIFSYHFEQLIGSAEASGSSALIETPDKGSDSKVPVSIPWLIALTLVGVGIGIYVAFSRTIDPPPKLPLPPTGTPTKNPNATVAPAPIPPVVTQPSSPSIGDYLAWGLVFLGLASLTTWFAWKILINSRSNQPIAKSTKSTELIQTVNDEMQIAKALKSSQNIRRDLFTSTTEFFPVTQRQMKQSWRHLRRMVREGIPTELDLEATIRQIGKEGILLNPVLTPRRINRTQLLLLIDRDGSMVPFHSLTDRLADTATREGKLGDAGIYYFHNCPIDYLYQDPHHSLAETISSILPNLGKNQTVVLIISDAGAARGRYNPERIELTQSFLNLLKKQVRNVAWLNPMPRSRWARTTAAEIALNVPMFEVSRQGLDGAIDRLRGRYSHVEGMQQ